MKSFRDIYRTYLAVDGELAAKEAAARSARTRAGCGRRRIINDQAFYVMLFAQLEDYIGQQCDRLIVHKQRSSRWASRRLWDTADATKLSFKNRVALLTEKGKPLYNKIMSYYTIRCDIAHGTVLAAMPAIPTVALDFQQIARQIRSR